MRRDRDSPCVWSTRMIDMKYYLRVYLIKVILCICKYILRCILLLLYSSKIVIFFCFIKAKSLTLNTCYII